MCTYIHMSISWCCCCYMLKASMHCWKSRCWSSRCIHSCNFYSHTYYRYPCLSSNIHTCKKFIKNLLFEATKIHLTSLNYSWNSGGVIKIWQAFHLQFWSSWLQFLILVISVQGLYTRILMYGMCVYMPFCVFIDIVNTSRPKRTRYAYK